MHREDPIKRRRDSIFTMRNLLAGFVLTVILFFFHGVEKATCEMQCAAGGTKETVLLTGGLGFIGSHTVEALLAKGYAVEVFDDASNGYNYEQLAVSHDSKWTRGDIGVVDDFNKITGKVDYIIHLAAAISVAESMSDPDKYNRTNVEGSRKVLEFAKARGVKMVVAASSAAVYGDIPDKLPIDESNLYGGKSPYALTKWQMEEIMQEYNKDHGVKAIALRFFNVYGPRQDPTSPYSGVISKFMDMAIANRDVTIFGDGEQTRDFIYVKDIARAIITAMESKKPDFDAFNVCTGKITTVKDLANTVIGLFGASSKVAHGPPRDGDIKKSVCNPTKAKTKLGFEAKTNVQDGLAATRDWFKAKK